MSPKILILEDESLLRWALVERLRKDGFEIREAADVAAARKHMRDFEPDLILVDYRLPDGDGVNFLRKLNQPPPPSIMMTAHGSVETAVSAMKAGALDFISKPFDIEEMALKVRSSLETARLRDEVDRRRKEEKEEFGLHSLLGDGTAMQHLREMVKKVAKSPAPTILLYGETGTGKGLVARVIHTISDRADRPFVTVTCTALPETLLESELFGHERGAFTDAKDKKRGLFEAAQGGTIFLDEIGDLSGAIQAKLLGVLEEKTFRPLGSTREVHVDVRIIVATHRNLLDLVKDGKFREDLYYRLSAIPVSIPPLRERGWEDVQLLVNHFLERYAVDFKKPIRRFSSEALDVIRHHGWPGNVRELRNVVERAVLLTSAEQVEAADLSLQAAPVAPAEDGNDGAILLPEKGLVLEDVERELVRQALERSKGNQTRAARLLGITRDQLRYRVEKFDLGPSAAERAERR